MLLEFFELIILLLITVVIYQSWKKPFDYPPGPWGLPFIGSIPLLGMEGFSKALWDLRKQYGEVISWKIGSQLIVIIFDYNIGKETFQNPAVSDHPDTKTLFYIQDDPSLGIIGARGARWQHNRRFALRHLRDFGMGKSKLVEAAHFEADNLVEELKKQVGRAAPVPYSLLISILNVAWQIVGYQRYDFDDEDINNFCKLVSNTQIYGDRLIILDIFPWLKKVCPKFLLNFVFKFHAQTDLSENVKKYFGKRIDEHLQDLDENNPRDFIDAYLIEMKKQQSNPQSTMSLEDLTFCVSDLFEGATETTSISLHWAMLYLAKYPHAQNKLQKEMDEFLPKGNSFTMDDKVWLPYTEAFINELLRHSSVTPAPPRATNTDTKIGNYFVPKGSLVILHGLMIHYDSRYFHSPEEFRPERFLNSEGKFSAPKEGFVPFGYGSRACIGETIARMELLVFLTKLVQNFHFEFPPGEEFSMEGVANPFFRPPKGSPKIVIHLR